MKPHLFQRGNWWFCRAGFRTYSGELTPKQAFERYYLTKYGLLGP